MSFGAKSMHTNHPQAPATAYGRSMAQYCAMRNLPTKMSTIPSSRGLRDKDKAWESHPNVAERGHAGHHASRWNDVCCRRLPPSFLQGFQRCPGVHIGSELLSIALSFRRGHRFTLAEVEVVMVIPRKDMHMIMPDILSAFGFVVLSSGGAITGIHAFEGQGNGLRTFLDTRRQAPRESCRYSHNGDSE